MDEQSAEAAAHAHAQAVVGGDIGAFVRSVTPDAFGKSMDLGNTTWEYEGYELRAKGTDGEDALFDVTYRTDQGVIALELRLRRMEGKWLVVDLERLDGQA